MADAVGCGGAGLTAKTSKTNTARETPPFARTRPHTPYRTKTAAISSSGKIIDQSSYREFFGTLFLNWPTTSKPPKLDAMRKADNTR